MGFMTVGSQMPELDPGGGGFFGPPAQYEIGSQNSPYKLRSIYHHCSNEGNAQPTLLFIAVIQCIF